MEEQQHGTDDVAAIRAGVINPPTKTSPSRDLPESSDDQHGDKDRMLAQDEAATIDDDSLDGDDEETEYDIEAEAD